MVNQLTAEQIERLAQARIRQQQTRERIESLASNSLLAWITRMIGPVVNDVVHKVVGWFWNLFR